MSLITNRYKKPTRVVTAGSTTATHVINVFFESCFILYGIPTHILTNNRVLFTSKLFARQCTMLVVKHLTTTASLPQTNGQVESYNRTIVTRLRNYGAENQQDWDEFLNPLTYVYHTQVQKLAGTRPFSVVLTPHPTRPTTVSKLSALTSSKYV